MFAYRLTARRIFYILFSDEEREMKTFGALKLPKTSALSADEDLCFF